jgi:hypothetical protein
MAHQQTNREGLPTRQGPHAAIDSRTAHHDLLHRVENYGHQRYPSLQQMADETVLLLQSLSQRLRRFQAQTGGFMKAHRPQNGTNRGTLDRHPALIPPVSIAETGRSEFTHATNEESSPRRRSTPDAGYQNHIGPSVPTSDTTMSRTSSIKMEHTVCNCDITTQRGASSEPRQDDHIRNDTFPRTQEDCSNNHTNIYQTIMTGAVERDIPYSSSKKTEGKQQIDNVYTNYETWIGVPEEGRPKIPFLDPIPAMTTSSYRPHVM